MLPLLVVSLLFLARPALSTSSAGFRASLIRADSAIDFHEAAEQGNHRLATIAAKLSNATSDVQAPADGGGGAYLMDLALGTPPLSFSAILDTGSDLIWTQCSPCEECFPQPTPLFDPSKSSTFSRLPCSSDLCSALPNASCTNNQCNYTYRYVDNSSTQGFLASETFTFTNVSVPGIGFGCGILDQGMFDNSSGIVGLGKGPSSLVSQLGAGRFSYCLDSNASQTSPLLFGSLAKSPNGSAQSTPLVRNPALPSFYYLNLTGITVGQTLLPIPITAFALQANGSGGVIMDSGTTLTYLEEAAYQLVRQAFISQVDLPVGNTSAVGLDLCFATNSATSANVPLVTLHFDGADMALPVANYIGLSPDQNLLCLGMMPSTGMSILGNILQQDMDILYDIEGGMLSFAPATCGSL